MRGLATQRKVQESLEAESERFAIDFNRQVLASRPSLAVYLHCGVAHVRHACALALE
jgi:hypothetical protein